MRKKLEISDKSCVYYLYQNDVLQYIGFSNVLITRIGVHYAEAKIPFNRVEYEEVDKECGLRIEKNEIDHYKPPYNKERGKKYVYKR